MSRISNIEFLEKQEQPTLTIRTRTSAEGLPALIGDCLSKICSYMAELGASASDLPFVAYHNMDMADLDVEVGLPVPRRLQGRDAILAGVIPGGYRILCMHLGPYSGLEGVYAEMAAWIPEHGFIPSGTAYEYYYNGPDFPPEQYLTRIELPVIKKS